MSAHLESSQLLALVALPEGDAERAAAYEHAAACSACRDLLREQEDLLAAIDASFAPVAISPALAARVHARVYPRRWPRLVLLASWIASLLLVLLPRNGDGALSAVVGVHCLLSESAFAVAPLGLAAWLTRAGRVQLDATTFALTGALGGVVGQLWLLAHCPVHGAALHAFVFHFLTVLALSLLAGAVGPRFLAPHP